MNAILSPDRAAWREAVATIADKARAKLPDSAVVFWRIPNELSSRHGWLLLGE